MKLPTTINVVSIERNFSKLKLLNIICNPIRYALCSRLLKGSCSPIQDLKTGPNSLWHKMNQSHPHTTSRCARNGQEPQNPKENVFFSHQRVNTLPLKTCRL